MFASPSVSTLPAPPIEYTPPSPPPQNSPRPPYTLKYVFVLKFLGFGVGWQRRCRTYMPINACARQPECHGLGIVRLLFGSHHDGYRVRYVLRGGQPYLRTRGIIASCNVNIVEHPRGSCIVIPTHCCLWNGHTRIQSITNWRRHPSISKKVGIRCRCPSHERFWKGGTLPSHATAQTPQRLLALGASNAFLVGEDPTCSVPAKFSIRLRPFNTN